MDLFLPRSYFSGTFAAIFNSRQGKKLSGKIPWVSNTIRAAEFVRNNDWILITSVEPKIWDLQVYACRKFGIKQLIVCPAKANDFSSICESLIHDFDLDRENTGFGFFPKVNTKSPKANWSLRDDIIFALANVIMPVSIRPDGNIEKKLELTKDKELVQLFRIPYSTKNESEPKSYPVDAAKFRQTENWDHIAHWTHIAYSPWPNENKFKYYDRLTNSQTYPFTAFATLCNILETGILYGSTKNMRGGISSVAFSSKSPQEMLQLMSWRRRFIRPNFEPYAIAIRRHAAALANIRPVIYGPPSLYRRLSVNDRPYFQSEGIAGGNWKPEKEWRHIGDLFLSKFDPCDLLVIVEHQNQKQIIEDCFGLNCFYLFE